jgi:hypothetical protein
MRASIVGASEGDAPAARAAMRHLTARISSPSGRRSRRISVGVDPPVSHDPGSFEEKLNEDGVLGELDTGLKDPRVVGSMEALGTNKTVDLVAPAKQVAR